MKYLGVDWATRAHVRVIQRQERAAGSARRPVPGTVCPGANGQGITRDEALDSLRDAIALILEHRREEGLRGVPDGASQHAVALD